MTTSNDEEIRLAQSGDVPIRIDANDNQTTNTMPKWPAVELEFQDLTYSVPHLNGSQFN